MTARTIDDPAALRDYLVRLAMEAFDAASIARAQSIPQIRQREAFAAHIRERMAQAAQTIVLEVADVRAVGLVSMEQIRAALRDYPDSDFSSHRVPAEEAIRLDQTVALQGKLHRQEVARVRREALREAADAIDYDSHHAQAVAVLRAMADEIERGGA